MKLIEGQLIHRRYRLDSRLAQGGMGEVWKGYDIQLGREVAIKALRSDVTNAEAKLRRLRAEAHNSANLAHPNIAALFEYYEHDGIGFLIMEYVPSKSLADLFHSKGAMDPIELLPILIQTARGLFVAHSHGVIHRDVKPANIMVSDTGEVKITDFGVSYSTGQGQITQDGMVVGTAQYISPEQAQGQQATPQSDIYSLGVVAYEGLAGHRPFTGTTPVDIAAREQSRASAAGLGGRPVTRICHVNAGQGPVGSPERRAGGVPYAGTHRTPSAGSADRNGRHRHGHVRQSTAAPSDQHATHCFGGPGLKIGRE